jgi:hypothetical protein
MPSGSRVEKGILPIDQRPMSIEDPIYRLHTMYNINTVAIQQTRVYLYTVHYNTSSK